jgi:hypothetical protein
MDDEIKVSAAVFARIWTRKDSPLAGVAQGANIDEIAASSELESYFEVLPDEQKAFEQ